MTRARRTPVVEHRGPAGALIKPFADDHGTPNRLAAEALWARRHRRPALERAVVDAWRLLLDARCRVSADACIFCGAAGHTDERRASCTAAWVDAHCERIAVVFAEVLASRLGTDALERIVEQEWDAMAARTGGRVDLVELVLAEQGVVG